MIPGAHYAIVCGKDADLVGIGLRMMGFEVRDSLASIIDGHVWITWLVRVPLSEPSITANIIKHGQGALHLAAVRVGSELVGGWRGAASHLHDGGLSRHGGEARPVRGRWPANVLVDDKSAEQMGVDYFPSVNSMSDLVDWLGRLLGSPPPWPAPPIPSPSPALSEANPPR